MPTKKPRVKYPGRLNKSIPQKTAHLIALSGLYQPIHGQPNAQALTQGGSAYENWLNAKRADVIVGLLNHFQIRLDQKPETVWFQLAYHLALDHVPAMRIAETRGPGRPPTARLNDLLDPPAPKKRGAPKKWDDELHLALVEWVDEFKAEAAGTGRRLSDRMALLELVKHLAKSQGKAEYRALKALSRFQKQLQIARKQFPKNSTP